MHTVFICYLAVFLQWFYISYTSCKEIYYCIMLFHCQLGFRKTSCPNPQLYALVLLFITRTEMKSALPKQTFQLQRSACLNWVSQFIDVGSPPEWGRPTWEVSWCLEEAPKTVVIRNTNPKLLLSTNGGHVHPPGHRDKLRGLMHRQSLTNQVSLLSQSVEHVLILAAPHQPTGGFFLKKSSN